MFLIIKLLSHYMYNRYSSHVLQTLFKLFSNILDNNNNNNSEDPIDNENIYNIIEELIISTVNELSLYWEELFHDIRYYY